MKIQVVQIIGVFIVALLSPRVIACIIHKANVSTTQILIVAIGITMIASGIFLR